MTITELLDEIHLGQLPDDGGEKLIADYVAEKTTQLQKELDEVKAKLWTCEAALLIWSSTFQKYQSFEANGLKQIRTSRVTNDYDDASRKVKAILSAIPQPQENAGFDPELVKAGQQLLKERHAQEKGCEWVPFKSMPNLFMLNCGCNKPMEWQHKIPDWKFCPSCGSSIKRLEAK